MVWFIKKVDGTCKQCLTLTSMEAPIKNSPSRDDEIFISASVGIYGGNFSSDVLKIQNALNQVPLEKGGASPKLEIDGNCGSNSKKAIQIFQLKHFGWKVSDGLIEPGKKTLAKLNEILGKKKGTGESHDLVAFSVIQSALNMVVAAQANLLAASPVVDSKNASIGGFSAFSREYLMRHLNQHFSLDSLQDRRKAFNLIQNKYNRMRQVFQRPGGPWGVAIFERDPIYDDAWAYTYGGGYFKAGQVRHHKGNKVRLDSLYLGTRFFNMADQNLQAFIVVHELAHFVAQYNEIIDFAYNNEGSPKGVKVKNLSPELKILNAECYANFAYAARTGKDPLNLR